MYEASCHHKRCPEASISFIETRNSSNWNISGISELRNSRNLTNATNTKAPLSNGSWYQGRWSQTIITRYPYYKDATTVNWYFLSAYAILEHIITLGTGNIEPMRTIEMFGLSFMMLIGYILFDVWFLSFCFRILMIIRRGRADFLFKIESIRLYLSDVNVSRDVLNNIEAYFVILWQKKDGIKSAPHFDTLPSPLQMEIMYDINCAHLHRSLLFFDLKEFYLRTLSLFMKHEFLLPGDVLYHQGVVKTDLVVITKGILEILSDEDDESPIIAFQAGTVLGEAALFFSLPAKATVRAAVYSEVKLIDRVDFIRNISNYPVALSYLKDRILYRIRTSRKNIKQEASDVIELDSDDKNSLIPIKVLKDRLIEKQKRVAAHPRDKGYRVSAVSTLAETTNSSKFFYNLLALYQLSNEDSNIETPVVCLTYNFPWILDSTSSLVRFWEQIVVVVHLLFLIVYAYQVVFVRQLDEFVHDLRFGSDVVCLIDVLLLTCTSVVLKDCVLKTFKEIIRYRMKSIDFYLNAIPVFPYEYFMLAIDNIDEMYYNRIFDLLMAIKILRLQRCFSILRNFQNLFYFNNIVFSVSSTLMFFVFVTYFSGCMIYLHSCLFDVCTENSWFFKMMLKSVQNKEEKPCYLYPLTSSLYFATNIWLHLGLGDIKVILPDDLYIVVIYLLCGILVLTYMMSAFAATLSIVNLNPEAFQREVYSFQKFLEHYNVPLHLREQVNKFFALQWWYDRAIGRQQFKKIVPEHLQMVVYKTELMELLNQVPLFQLVDVDFLMDIVLSSKIAILPKGTTVCYAGDVDREMFIIQNGNCSLYNCKGEFVKNVKAGDYFGNVCLLFNTSRTTTVRTTTNCKLVHITFRALSSALSMFPGEMKVIQKVVQDPELLNELEAIEQKRLIHFAEKIPPKLGKKRRKSLIRIRASFICAASSFKRTGGREKYWDPFRKMGKWQILGLLLMPITIHPEALILKIWLLLRTACLLAMGCCFPLALGLPPAGGNIVYIFMLIAEVTAYIELYLFLHIAYYNEQGLLVTHPKLTALNYLTHGFPMDLVAALPYYAIVPLLTDDIDNLDPTIQHLVKHETYCRWRAMSLLQYHRILGFIMYVQSDVLSKKNVYSFMIILPLVLLGLLIGTTVVITKCQYKFFPHEMTQYANLSTIQIFDYTTGINYYGYMVCAKASWIQNVYHQVSGPLTVIVLAFYWFLNIFSQVGLGDVVPNDDVDMYLTMFIAFFGICVFSYILSFLSGQTGRSSILALEYQQKIREMLHFLHKEGVADAKVNKIYRYFEYVWNRTTGMEKKEMLMDLNSALKGDIALLLYEKALREVSIFRKISRPYLRVLAKNLREEYFLKGDTIIKCYNVHNSVFIILRGTVDVLTPYDDYVTSIGIGGFFGNIHQAAPGCSSVTFVAQRNVDALRMSSETFFLIAQEYPAVQNVLDGVLSNVGDFIMPLPVRSNIKLSQDYEADDEEVEIQTKTYHSGADVEKFDTSADAVTAESGTRVIVPKTNCLACLLFLKPKFWFRFALEPDHIIFKYVWYTTIFATCYQMFMIPYMFVSQNFNLYIFISTLLFEPVFYVRIFFFMHEAYLDNYGTYVRRFRPIARHYFRNYRRVCWDFIPNLPIYLLYGVARPDDRLFLFSCLRMFHLLRWKYILQAFAVWSAPLMAKRAPILITKTIVVFLFTIHYFALAGFMIFGNFGDFSHSTRTYLRSASRVEAYIFCLYYVSSVISTTGVGDIIPNNLVEFIFTIVGIISTKIAYSALIVCFLMGVRILSQHIINYEHKVGRMKKFLQHQGLSDHLMEKLWTYIKQIWRTDNGLHMPELLENAPYVMRCEIMTEIFSEHLRNGYLFKDINEALLTQICNHLKRVVFFKGNYIVQNGDTNASMYWIHRGEVSVLTVHPNLTETRHEMLYVHDMFGLAQGLNYGMPHKYSYRAETHCDILVLKLETWEYVLQHFPKDRQIIFQRMLNSYTIL
ncbi:hypothetical protein HHI36_020616 [Cryptolaemus montrouzieri]|uniref:Cyclic nucleotide-binding domain-containing protein n=1 Tax=Cryptolaemus montrouzieri TaxID=559131 RepID=A0ABD2NAU4_9CUCU